MYQIVICPTLTPIFWGNFNKRSTLDVSSPTSCTNSRYSADLGSRRKPSSGDESSGSANGSISLQVLSPCGCGKKTDTQKNLLAKGRNCSQNLRSLKGVLSTHHVLLLLTSSFVAIPPSFGFPYAKTSARASRAGRESCASAGATCCFWFRPAVWFRSSLNGQMAKFRQYARYEAYARHLGPHLGV